MNDLTPTTMRVIGHDHIEVLRTVQLPAEPTLEQLHAVILPELGTNFMEHVTVLYNGERRDMFVDEEGRRKGLPRNEIATSIYRAATLATQPTTPPEALEHIVGNAVLFPDRQVWF